MEKNPSADTGGEQAEVEKAGGGEKSPASATLSEQKKD